MQAIDGGKATNATIDAQKIAVLLRGGLRPPAYVYPADMRATRDRLRRRIHWRRKRAALLGHSHQTKSQANLPDIGKKIAYKAHRNGVAERFADPAVQNSIAVDRARIGQYDELLRDIELSILKAAKPQDAHTRYRLRTVPGIGEILRLVLLDEIHDIQRFPRVQACVSYARLVKCAKEAAGKRYGTAGTKLGNAYRKWACSEAAVLGLRHHPPGQKLLARLANKQGQGKALTVLAHKLARAVSYLLTRERAFDMPHFLHSASGAERMSPVPNWPISGGAWSACAVVPIALRRERCGAHRPWPLSPAL
jgi:transposase